MCFTLFHFFVAKTFFLGQIVVAGGPVADGAAKDNNLA